MRCWVFSTTLCVVLYSHVGGYLGSPPPTVESIVAEWGTGNPEHDRYVVDALLGSTDGVNRYGMRMEPRFLDALTKWLREKPELLRHVFQGIRDCGGGPPPCDNDEWYIALWLSNMRSLVDSPFSAGVFQATRFVVFSKCRPKVCCRPAVSIIRI